MTRAEKKGKENKGKLIEQIREAASTHPHGYLFRVSNMRNQLFKEIRQRVDGRFFIGKNKVMAVALGSDEASECITGGATLASRLHGNVGVVFCKEDLSTLTGIMDSAETPEFARTGSVADMTVIIEADAKGLRNFETQELLSATLESQLRKAGMPTRLQGGIILLANDNYTVCQAGNRITSDQARILKTFGVKMATFRVRIVGHLFEGQLEEIEDPFASEDGGVAGDDLDMTMMGKGGLEIGLEVGSEDEQEQ